MNVYLRWLLAINLILDRIRYEGFVSTLRHTDNPEESPVFKFMDLCGPLHIYEREFTADLLRLIASLSNRDDGHLEMLQEYVDAYLHELEHTENFDLNVYLVIWTSLKFSLRGRCPIAAAEYARQVIPYDYKLSANELDDIVRKNRYSYEDSAKPEGLTLADKIELYITTMPK